MRTSIRLLIFASLSIILYAVNREIDSPRKSAAFDLSNASIPVSEIFSGGPPKDGIPSIDKPKFTSIKDVDYLNDDDIVIGVNVGNEQRAYPLRILVWHEIVNDKIGSDAFVITYCPLCGTAMVFSRNMDNKTLSFGVSGLLYNSDVLMYDRQTDSLWTQLGMESVSGPMVGKSLEWLSSEKMTWEAWKNKYPKSKVLNTETGHRRNYKRMPYAGYEDSEETIFPYKINRDELNTKAWVAGIIVNDEAAAFSVDLLAKEKSIETTLGNKTVVINYDSESRSATATLANGQAIPLVMVFWFAWQAFYPETKLFSEGLGNCQDIN